MFVSDSLSVNEKGHLTIGGVDTVYLAEKYGTPLYVMDEASIRGALRDYKKSIDENYENGGMVAFASKACAFKAIYEIVKEEGCGADVVSGGELYTAIQAGFPPERLYFHGNFKTEDELAMALDYGVGRIIVDNGEELEALSAMAKARNVTANIYLRITPGVDAHTHSFIMTGQNDSKFGFTLETGEALQAAKKAAAMPNIALKGMHCHIGSQIFDEAPFAHTAELMIGFLAQVRDETGLTLTELNMGGGFGSRYVESDVVLPYGEYMRRIAGAMKEVAAKLSFPLPYIVIEPGRSIVGNAGITLYTVGSVKHIPGIRTFVIVDGGMTDNPRYALYQSKYTAVVANKANLPADQVVTIAGRCCESGDLIQEHTKLQPCQRGDIVAVMTTGAYNYSMSSNYNRIPRPAIVMIKDGTDRVVVKAETYADVMRNDL